jgi:ribonucleoside-diphosphate reductase alpha chain
MTELATDISRHVWQTKYRYTERHSCEQTIAETWRRLARALAAVEPENTTNWEEQFFSILQDFKFLPGGRIHAGAGTARNVTLLNCFVMGTIEDSVSGIFHALQEAALTMQQGGGIGVDFSTLRPRGTAAKGVGTIASGAVSFMQIWDAMCGTILSTGARRGAMMATLRCDHPDIEEFVTAKQRSGQLRRFNLSVQVSDAFIAAVRSNDEWPLVFPTAAFEGGGETILRDWPGENEPIPCRVIRRVSAAQLWERILRATYDHSEPGVLFIDRINRLNNLWYRERLTATNPCGEVPLPPYGACDLGSLNLTRFVVSPFTKQARIDFANLEQTAGVAVRFLDNVIDVSRFPLPQQAESAHGSRRIGLGITGLADAMVMLGLSYGGEESLAVAGEVMRTICHAAYRASTALATEKHPFPYFERGRYLTGAFIGSLPEDIQSAIARRGIRNSHLIAIAPTGTISLLAGNVSSGLEPIFAASYIRSVLTEDGTPKQFVLTDYALDLWRQSTSSPTEMPPGFVTTAELPIAAHVQMQAALQPFVDNSIAKTINVPEKTPFDDFKRIYDMAYDMGLKGCTTFRVNPVTGAILSEQGDGVDAPHCCVAEREAD